MDKKYFLILLVWIQVFCSGCSLIIKKEPLPEDTIEAFETAMNEMDVDAMLECIDPKVVKGMKTGMDLMLKAVGKISGVDISVTTEDLLSMFPLMKGITEVYGQGQLEYPKVNFQTTETYIKGDKATVYFTEMNTGENTVINMKLNEGKWVIIMDTKVISKENAERVLIAGQSEDKQKKEIDNRKESKKHSEKLEIAGTFNLKEAVESFSILDIFNQDKIEKILRTLLEIKAQ